MHKGRSTGDQIRELRRNLEEGLATSGERRIRLLEELDRVEAEMRGLMFDASEIGMTVREIGGLAQLTYSAVAKWIVRERQER